MYWEDERYVRLYVRDTTNWVLAPWQGRAVLPSVVRKLDRAGSLDLNEDGMEGLAALIRFPIEVVEAGMAYWLKKGTFVLRGSLLSMPNYRRAQEAKASDKKRQQDKRDRDRDADEGGVTPPTVSPSPVTTTPVAPDTRDEASRTVGTSDDTSHNVTNHHAESRGVTPSLAYPSLTKPSPPTPQGEPGEVSGRPPDRCGISMPASERALWGTTWIARYEEALIRTLRRPWAFERKQLGLLEQAIDTFCLDKTRIEDWIEESAAAFVVAVRNDDPKLWSAYQPKGLLRWFNEGGRAPASSVASESPAVVAERERREREFREASKNRTPMPDALKNMARVTAKPPAEPKPTTQSPERTDP